MEKKCFIKSREGCIIEDSDVILLGLTSALAVALSVPLIAILSQIQKRWNMYLKLKFWKLWQRYIIGIFGHERQKYLIGKTSLNIKDIDFIEEELVKIGFQPDYFSFNDYGQITSMRIIYIDGLIDTSWRQVHVRVYEDSEVTVHDELTYEEDVDRHLKGDTLTTASPLILDKIKETLKIE